MAEHIDRDLLYSDLRYRFEYLSKFLNFTADDIAALNSLAKMVHPMIPMIIDKLYQRILDFDITKHYFLKNQYGFQHAGTTDETQITLRSERLVFPKDNLRKYLERILRQRVWNDAFLKYLSQIGKMHTNIAGSHSLNVDYIHINLLLGYLEHVLVNTISNDEQIDGTMKTTALVALNKFFWIQNDFFTMHFITKSKDSITSDVTQTTVSQKKRCTFM